MQHGYHSLSKKLRKGTAWVAVVAVVLVWTQVHAQPPVKRARAPRFPQSVQESFFPDARGKLSGPRPTAPAKTSSGIAPSVSAAPAAAPDSAGWSALITAESLEDEIKAGQLDLAAAVQNATRFKGGQYQQARRNLSVLATMFGIAAEYDGRVRWQREAAPLAALLDRAATNTKVASDAALNECRARADDLETLVRGGSLSLSQGDNAVLASRSDRPALMQRLEQAHQQRILPAMANEREFSRQTDSIVREAEIIAAVARWITRDGYEFADDDSFVEYARAMQQQAAALRSAAQQGDFQQARQNAAQLGQSCTHCHEGYRS